MQYLPKKPYKGKNKWTVTADGREHSSSWLPVLATAGTGQLETRWSTGEVLPALTEAGRRSAEGDVAWNAPERSPELCRGSGAWSGRLTQRSCILKTEGASWRPCGAEGIAGVEFRWLERRDVRRTSPEKTVWPASSIGAGGLESYF